jgi:3-oxoacyl-[acyl-carrier-protein] synthase II
MQNTHQIDFPTHEIESSDSPKLPLRFRADVLRRRARRRRVVITGIGVVAPSGIGTEALWNLLVSGRSAARLIENFDVARYPVRIAAQVPNFQPRDFMRPALVRSLGRFCHLAIAASRLAVEGARPQKGLLQLKRTGFFLGTAAGAIEIGEEGVVALERYGASAVKTILPLAVSPHSAAAQCAGDLGIRGPVSTVCSDCPAGLDAVAAAFRQIRTGALDIAIAGGADAPVTPLLLAGFGRSGVLARANDTPETACRPFDRRRSGFLLAEGAAMLVLEELESARSRGAHIFGELLGVGSALGSVTYTGSDDEHPNGDGYLEAAVGALQNAGLQASDIEYVNAHAPGMPSSDVQEARSLRALLGSRRVPITSSKGALGQALAASGVLQLVSTLLTFEYELLPPTTNCDDLDPKCDLDVVRGAPRRGRPRRALVTSHGVGGGTTSVLVGEPNIGHA